MPTRLTRADLAQIPGMTPKALAAFEELPQRIDQATDTATAAVEATQGASKATVLTLSPNDAFDNERVLALGAGLYGTDGGAGANYTLRLRYPITVQGGYRLTFNTVADTTLSLPPQGMVATTIAPGPYADDTAAAADGVQVGETYRKAAGSICWRQT